MNKSIKMKNWCVWYLVICVTFSNLSSGLFIPIWRVTNNKRTTRPSRTSTTALIPVSFSSRQDTLSSSNPTMPTLGTTALTTVEIKVISLSPSKTTKYEETTKPTPLSTPLLPNTTSYTSNANSHGGSVKSVHFMYDCQYASITSLKGIRESSKTKASNHNLCFDACLSSIPCLRFSWNGLDICMLYFDGILLEKDFHRYMKKGSVCGILKNRDKFTTKQTIKFSSSNIMASALTNLWVGSDGEQVKWANGCVFQYTGRLDFIVYTDYKAGATFDMCADECLHDPRCGSFNWSGDLDVVEERYCQLFYIHTEEKNIEASLASASFACGYVVKRVMYFSE